MQKINSWHFFTRQREPQGDQPAALYRLFPVQVYPPINEKKNSRKNGRIVILCFFFFLTLYIQFIIELTAHYCLYIYVTTLHILYYVFKYAVIFSTSIVVQKTFAHLHRMYYIADLHDVVSHGYLQTDSITFVFLLQYFLIFFFLNIL